MTELTADQHTRPLAEEERPTGAAPAASSPQVVEHLIGGAATRGASTRITDGEGFFLGPTLLDHVPTTSVAYTDEIFGPVLAVLRADSYNEVVDLVNENPYGNGVPILTNDGGAARRFSHEVKVGMVGVPIPVPMAYYSFGGWKNSLFGDTHAHGTEGVHFFTSARSSRPAGSTPPMPGSTSASLSMPDHPRPPATPSPWCTRSRVNR